MRKCRRQIIVVALLGIAVWSALGATAEPRIREASQPVAVTSATAMCQRCHNLDPLFSHPVDVNPTMRVPTGMPLENGKVTCLTCHELSHIATHTQTKVNKNASLRSGLTATTICSACHTGRTADTAKMMHPTAIGRAHLPTRSTASTSAGLDSESRTCLSCHDGTLASDVGIGGGDIIGDHAQGHPVGIRYQNGLRNGQPREMPVRPAAALDTRVRLFNGNIGCGSCHSPYSKQKGQLIMSNLGSKLCLSCHMG